VVRGGACAPARAPRPHHPAAAGWGPVPRPRPDRRPRGRYGAAARFPRRPGDRRDL